MSAAYRVAARPLLALQDSEKAHGRTIRRLERLGNSRLGRGLLSSLYSAPELRIERFGIEFPNPLGLAAGMDKRAQALPAWPCIGFGFIEVGGVTAYAQAGNPKPRMFRDWKTRSLVNRMGFNNDGAAETAARMEQTMQQGLWPKVPVAVNIGRSKITSNEDAAEDYLQTIEACWKYADMLIINVSSPNTPDLHQLQQQAELRGLLEACISKNQECALHADLEARPLLVKVSPDLTDEQLAAIARLARTLKLAGIVATNTTTTRPEIDQEKSKQVMSQQGGLSGAPLRERSTEVIRLLYQETEGQLPIIGVGGISNVEDAWEKITNGACLLQLYSALIFEGPSVAKNIVRGLKRKLKQHHLDSLDQAVGSAVIRV